MSDKVKYRQIVELDLPALRQQAGLTQTDIARYFELDDIHGYKSVAAWEAGQARPHRDKRAGFIIYLWDYLKLRDNPQEFERIWQIVAEEWHWVPISDAEWLNLSPGVTRPERNLTPAQVAFRELPGQALEVIPTPISSDFVRPYSSLTRWQQTAKPVKWLIILALLIVAGFGTLFILHGGVMEFGSVARNYTGSNDLAGIIDIDPKGLSAIQGYDLWFTSKIKDRWQIWRLDARSGQVKPVVFKMNGDELTFEQFVPAVSPDSQQIVFAASPCSTTERCGRDLYLASLVTLDANPLAADPCLDEYHPAWSPDGQRIVYHAGSDDRLGCSATPYGIWVIDLQKPQVTRQLTRGRDYDPVWSPNGRYIAYHSGNASWNIMVLDYPSCILSIDQCIHWKATEMSNKATSVSWISDYKIVFVSGQEGARDIYEIPVKPGKLYRNPNRLTDNQWDDEYPAVFNTRIMLWQAFQYEDKGNEGIATDRDAVIYVMNLPDRKALPLITGIGNARDGFLSSQQ